MTGEYSGTLKFASDLYSLSIVTIKVDASGNLTGSARADFYDNEDTLTGTFTLSDPAKGIVNGSITGYLWDVYQGRIPWEIKLSVLQPGDANKPLKLTGVTAGGWVLTLSGGNPLSTQPKISSAANLQVYMGVPYSFQVRTSPDAPATFSITGLPAGLTANASGLISGVATTLGASTVSVTATIRGKTAQQTLQMSVVPLPSTTPGNGAETGAVEITSPLSASVTTLRPGEQIVFSCAARRADGGAVSYAWDFGDGTRMLGESTMTHTFSAEGTYKVSVSASDGRGRGITSEVTITVSGVASIDLGSFVAKKKLKRALPLPGNLAGIGKLTFRVPSGVAGPGLRVRQGLLIGKPTGAGEYSFTVEISSRKMNELQRVTYSYRVTN